MWGFLHLGVRGSKVEGFRGHGFGARGSTF